MIKLFVVLIVIICISSVTAQNKKIGHVIIQSACDIGDVHIGNQIWMGCNLNVGNYRNGDFILEVNKPGDWQNAKTGAYCYYDWDLGNSTKYGKLYNFKAVSDPRGLAPTGWHVPSREEWEELVTFLGGSTIAGGKLKSTGTLDAGDGLWRSPNTGATNESGFCALPGGYYMFASYQFAGIDALAIWWTSSEEGNINALSRSLSFNDASIHASVDPWPAGFSVRCVRNSPSDIKDLNEIKQEGKFKIIPNPTSDYIDIHLELIENTGYKITIVNSIGQTVKELARTNVAKGLTPEKIDITDLTSGIYTFILQTENERLTENFIIVK